MLLIFDACRNLLFFLHKLQLQAGSIGNEDQLVDGDGVLSVEDAMDGYTIIEELLREGGGGNAGITKSQLQRVACTHLPQPLVATLRIGIVAWAHILDDVVNAQLRGVEPVIGNDIVAVRRFHNAAALDGLADILRQPQGFLLGVGFVMCHCCKS